MKEAKPIRKSSNSKEAAIFKKMLEDKKVISEHVRKGGKISEIKEKFNFVKLLSLKTKC